MGRGATMNKYIYIYGKISAVEYEENKLNSKKNMIVYPVGTPTVYYSYKTDEPYVIQMIEVNEEECN